MKSLQLTYNTVWLLIFFRDKCIHLYNFKEYRRYGIRVRPKNQPNSPRTMWRTGHWFCKVLANIEILSPFFHNNLMGFTSCCCSISRKGLLVHTLCNLILLPLHTIATQGQKGYPWTKLVPRQSVLIAHEYLRNRHTMLGCVRVPCEWIGNPNSCPETAKVNSLTSFPHRLLMWKKKGYSWIKTQNKE